MPRVVARYIAWEPLFAGEPYDFITRVVAAIQCWKTPRQGHNSGTVPGRCPHGGQGLGFSEARRAAGFDRQSVITGSRLLQLTGRDLRSTCFGLALWLIFLDAFQTTSSLVHDPPTDSATPRKSSSSFPPAASFMAAPWSTRLHHRRRPHPQAGLAIVAHLPVAIYIAEIYVASSFKNPLYVEEMNALDFLKTPTSRYRRCSSSSRPTWTCAAYIVLLMCSGGAVCHPQLRVALATGVTSDLEFGWNFGHPGCWYFNPMAWQFCSCSAPGAQRRRGLRRSRSPVTVGWRSLICVRFGITDMVFPRLGFLIPHWLGEWMYPIDKTISMMRCISWRWPR
jgi:hypothetical protein